MKKLNKIVLFISVILISGILLIPSVKVGAADGLIPTASSNIRRYIRRYSSIVSTNTGYMRVYYDSTNKKIGIEYYDDNFKIVSKKNLAMELDIYGGFYAGKDAYYIVEGQNNKEEDTSKEVIRVIKYDTNWNRVGAAKITGTSAFAEEVRYPFDYGTVEMVEEDGKLYIVTGHQGYVDDEVGQGHQGYLMIVVDEKELTGKIAHADLWHSFAQYIDYKDDNFYVLQLSEGSQRAELTKYNKSVFPTLNYFTSLPYVSVLEYGGNRDSVWAVSTYSSVDGMAISGNNILTIGTSIDQDRYEEASSSKLPHNVYLSVTPINDFSKEKTSIKWITDYTTAGKAFTGLEITKINDNRFMISWEEYEENKTIVDNDTLSTNVLHYVFIDENGNKLTNEFTVQASMSDCKPIVKGEKIVYYASNANMVDFYSIDANTGKFSKVMHRVAGENATWTVNNGVLTISGTGAMYVNPAAVVKFPLSSTLGVYSYSGSDNAWKPIKDSVTKLVVQKGITSIADEQFKYFSNLTEVELPNTLKTIGKSAFESDRNLRKILIPSSVTSIGEDALWAGSYWVGSGSKVIVATIYTPKGSYAETWANKNGVSVVNADTLNPPTQSTTPVNNTVAITGVKLNQSSVNITVGKTANLTVTITPSNTTQSKTLTWSSSNTSVATVDKNGTVKGVKAGTATITVKTINGKTASVKVTVTNPVIAITSVKINQSNVNIMVNKTTKLTATINPSNTTQSKTLTWSSSNKKIATVDKNGNVKGIKAGTATITVKTSNGKTASVKVTVKKATPIKSVKLNKTSAKLELNKTLQLKATINPSGTTDSKTLTWTSSNKKVATVDKNGKVTAVGGGSATITVKTSNGKKATVKITVSKINAKKAKIAAIKNQTQTGKALKPSVTVTLNGKTLKSGTDYTVTYKNNKNAGKATVTVKFKGNYTGSVKSTFLIIPKKVAIKNPSTTKKAITVKYTKVSGAKTYQIAYRVKGTKDWKYTTSTSASKKISKLTSGKQYEVMVRAGIKSGSKTLYGAWSDTKTIKVK